MMGLFFHLGYVLYIRIKVEEKAISRAVFILGLIYLGRFDFFRNICLLAGGIR